MVGKNGYAGKLTGMQMFPYPFPASQISSRELGVVAVVIAVQLVGVSGKAVLFSSSLLTDLKNMLTLFLLFELTLCQKVTLFLVFENELWFLYYTN